MTTYVTAGSVSVDATGVETKSGMAEKLYDNMKADIAAKPDIDLTKDDYIPALQGLGDAATSLAAGSSDAINADLTANLEPKLILHVVKQTTEGLNSDTTPNADAELTLSLAANTRYIIEALVVTQAATSMDMKLGFVDGGLTVTDLGAIVDSTTITSVASYPVLAATTAVKAFRVTGHIKGSAAGNISIGWSQNVSSGDNLFVLAGSWFRAWKEP